MTQYRKIIRNRLFIPACLVFALIPLLFSKADEISGLEDKTNSLQSELAGLNKDMVAISEKIDRSNEEAALTESEIARTNDQLADALEKQGEQYEEMKSRIKYMYENGNTTWLEWLCGAEDISDFLNKAHFIQDVSSYDKKMLDELTATTNDIADKKTTLETQQKNLLSLRADLEKQKEDLEAKAQETSTNLQDFQNKLAAAKEEQARRIAEEEAKRKAAIEKEKAEQAARAAQEAAAQSSSGTQTTTNGNVINTDNTHSVAADDVTLLAAILQCEAYQNYNSLLAVATVIMNRVESPRFGNTISDVVYASGQFEPVSSGRLNKVLQAGPTSLSMQVAQDALNGARLNEVIDCYYFLYAPAAGNRGGVIIGDNLFFQSW